MLNTWPAYEDYLLDDGFAAVRLRPSLRAASILESRFGLKRLFRDVDEWRVSTVRSVILACAVDADEASLFLAGVARAPLRKFVEIAHAPVTALCRAFIPAPKDGARDQTDSELLPWSELYRQLYRTATSYLRLSPAEAWDSTPNEITEAFDAHIAMLKATGVLEDAEVSTATKQAEQNVAEGLDPEFDRAGLRALKAKLMSGR